MRTGFPDADARDDFARMQRQRLVARLRARLRGLAGDPDRILLFDEVVQALGRVGERTVGVHIIPVDAAVGTVDRDKAFDRLFRPTSVATRQRWERMNAAMRRGEPVPPIDVYKVGDVYFVRDGHHRVSVARALGLPTIEASVTEIVTAEPIASGTSLTDLPLIDHRRIFRERVPLPPAGLARIRVGDPWDYAVLAEGVEAWAFRRSVAAGELLDRARAAQLWFDEEYVPVVEMLRAADLVGDQTETEAYLRLSAERFRVLKTHDWSEEVIDRLRHLRRGGRA